MESIRQLFVSLGLEWDAAGFLQAELAMKALELGAQALVRGLQAVVTATAEAIVETAEYGAAVDDAAKRTGASREALQELGYAAQQSGSSAGEMNHALTKLARTMAEAAGGSDEAGKAFAALGIKVTNADGTLRATDEVLVELADKFVGIDNPAKRSALAMDVFGRSGADLLPLLLEGSDGIAALRTEAIDLGLVMSSDSVKAAESFGDSMSALQQFASSLKRDLGSLLIEGLAPMLESTIEWVKANRELIKTRVQTFARAVLGVLRGTVAVLQVMGKALGFVIDNWRGFALLLSAVVLPIMWGMRAALLEQLVAFGLNTVSALLYGATQVAAAAAAAAAWTAANAPLLVSIALLAFLLLAAEDVWVALEGGDSLIGEIGPKWTAFLDEFARDVSDNPLIAALQAVVFYVSDLEGRLLPMLKDSWASALFQPLTAALELLFKLFRGTASFVDYIKTIPGVGLFIEQAQASPLFSGASSSPEAAAAAAPSSPVIAPRFSVGSFTVQAAPGQSPNEVAGEVERKLDDWFTTRLQELVTQGGG